MAQPSTSTGAASNFDVDKEEKEKRFGISSASFSRKTRSNNPHFNSTRKSSFTRSLPRLPKEKCPCSSAHGENANNPDIKNLPERTSRLRPCPCPDERRRAEENGQDDPEVEPRGLVAWQVGGLGRVRVLRPEGDAEKGRGRHCQVFFSSSSSSFNK